MPSESASKPRRLAHAVIALALSSACASVTPPEHPGRIPAQQPEAERRAALHLTPDEMIKMLGLPFVTIPPGRFQMGCSPGDRDCDKEENPPHSVTITKEFDLMVTDVTARQFAAWVQWDGRRKMPPQPDWSADDVPVVNVTWDEASAFCSSFGGRLPTEAEWEYAARAGTTGARYESLDAIAWYDGNSDHRAHAVGTKIRNAFGLYDMLGNVWQWTGDWYGDKYYNEKVEIDPKGPASGEFRMLRSGSWDFIAGGVRASVRYYDYPTDRLDDLGFRCARDAHSPVTVPPQGGRSEDTGAADTQTSTSAGTKGASAPAAAPTKGAQPVAGYVPSTPLPFVTIPPGKFQMGCSPGDKECNEDENPPHSVTITKEFDLMVTDVTARQFAAWVQWDGHRKMPPQPDWPAEDVPVVNVTWDEARAFCSSFGGRLPTEAEWEYAARAGTTGARYESLDAIAWYDGNSDHRAHAVGTKMRNAFGLYDMLGNVWQWTGDWYGDKYYNEKVEIDPKGPASGRLRVLRGGSWDDGARWARASYRSMNGLGYLNGLSGFRCARDAHSPVKPT